MKFYIIAGEASGDLHGSNLIKAIKEQAPDSQFRGLGGDLMEHAGASLQQHYSKLSFMGFYEVFKNMGTLQKAMNEIQDDVLSWKPDVVIYIDFGGFNMRLSKMLKTKGLTNFYFISPKIWAWNQSRVEGIKKHIDRMFVILPFEKDFYKSFDYDVDYVGNPLTDAIAEFKPSSTFYQDNDIDPNKPIIALLPGSRRQEVEEMLPYMTSIIPPYLLDYQFVIAGSNHLDRKLFESFKRHECIKIVYNQTYDLLSHAKAALVTSGTATLETALFNVPQVVCYKTSFISYAIARLLIKVKFIGLVNLIAGKEVVKELIQDSFNPSNLMVELDKVLKDEENIARIKTDYAELSDKVGSPGACKLAGEKMLGYLGYDLPK